MLQARLIAASNMAPPTASRRSVSIAAAPTRPFTTPGGAAAIVARLTVPLLLKPKGAHQAGHASHERYACNAERPHRGRRHRPPRRRTG